MIPSTCSNCQQHSRCRCSHYWSKCLIVIFTLNLCEASGYKSSLVPFNDSIAVSLFLENPLSTCGFLSFGYLLNLPSSFLNQSIELFLDSFLPSVPVR